MQPRDLESDLLDLTECRLEDLRNLDRELVARALDRQLRQLCRSRGNFGGTGEPDRVD